MDYLRILKVPIHPTTLLLVAVIAPIATLCLWGMLNTPAGLTGFIGVFFLQIWVFKYCYVIVEKLADGASEPPVMDQDMLSPFEMRPWLQLGLLAFLGTLAWWVGGKGGAAIALFTILWIPASIALLGAFSTQPWGTLNPLTLFRLVRGLGLHYLVLLAAMFGGVALAWLMWRAHAWLVTWVVVTLFYQLFFFALVGGVLYARREQLGYEPTHSPERIAARDERERQVERAKMADDVFTRVRLGKHVDATAPLADWLRNLDAETAVRDSSFIVDKALDWDRPAALNTIGSTVIRHLLRFGRADAALLIFETLRARSPRFTMDSAPDLRLLADYAESAGREDLAATMRLETPVFHPPA